MSTTRRLFGLSVFLAVMVSTAVPARVHESIVPPAYHISEREARLELAALLSQDPKHWPAAETEYTRLLSQDPTDPKAGLGLARIKAELGHAESARELSLHLLKNHPKNPALHLALANLVLKWGDFGLAEDVLRDLLDRLNLDTGLRRQARMEQARVFTAAQRYEEAEGILKSLLLDDPQDAEALTALVLVHLKEKDFPAALALLDHATPAEKNPDSHQEILRLRSSAQAGAGDTQAALETLEILAVQGLSTSDDDLMRAGLLLKMNRPSRAEKILVRLLDHDPNRIRARLLLADQAPNTASVLSPAFVSELCRETISPARLTAWSEEYARIQAYAQARTCCLAALKRDPDFFPARLGLVQIEASARRFDVSLALLQKLLSDFPDTTKLLLLQARILSWAEEYEKSLNAYAALHKKRPQDPIPLMEAARTAMWSKDPAKAQALYRALQASDTVKSRAPEALILAETIPDPVTRQALTDLKENMEQGRVYPTFQKLQTAYADHRSSFSGPAARRMDEFLNELRPTYRIQQAAFLEEQAKMLAWNRRFLPALDAYEHLIAIRPGNLEALFDQVQIQCVLGLYDQEERTCRRLLDLDPLHGQAAEALKRLEIRSSPGLRVGYGYWNEQSHGGSHLSAMERHHQELAFDLPFSFGRYRLLAAQHFWLERPKSLPQIQDDFSGSYAAQGLSMGLEGVLTSRLRGFISATGKHYDKSRLGHRLLGGAGLEYNLRDWVRLGLEYERREELANGPALRREIMADIWRVRAVSALTRRLDLALAGEFRNMSDDNQGLVLHTDLGIVLTDHPREIKVTLSGESRDFQHETHYLYQGSELIDITHPYWTPQNYTAGTVTLQWRHDLAEYLFCGAEKNVYQINLAASTDSEDNPAVRLEGLYQLDFAERWGLTLEGLIHSSPQWNALGLQGNLEYRF